MPKSAAAFWDKIAVKYAKRPIDDETSYQRKLEMTQERFRPDMQIFEYGCGTGSTALTHAPHVQHILATDIAPSMIEIAREKAIEQGVTNVTFEVGTLEDTAQKGGQFDMVLGLNILHLLEDPKSAIKSSFDLLKPGGYFMSSSGCLKEFPLLMRIAIPIAQTLGAAPFIKFFSRAELEKDMVEAGFELEDTFQPAKDKAVFIVARKPV